MRNTLDTLEIPNRIYALHILFNMDSTPIINGSSQNVVRHIPLLYKTFTVSNLKEALP